ncbi:NAD(P)/FAD-dependent oxidoreductase [Paenibacillus sp. y28]|uniref:NAD(P)/FAD-dependent oxidoreductase n=1 Tax=Paenibacillus sp. y28 TaxID=3129110 RepID=UPI003019EE60
MLLDCAIIGGGPAGLNAALMLGRSRRNVMLFDDNRPRNGVTQRSHGFLTRDGVAPEELRRIAREELGKYASVQWRQARITEVTRPEVFQLETGAGERYHARTIIIAAGLREELPAVDGMKEYYGKSLFGCPYCDGWELRDRPLVLITDHEHAFHTAKLIANWSRDLIVCTNGRRLLTTAQQEALRAKGISVYEQRIAALAGRHGQLEKVVWADGAEARRAGGFVTARWTQAASFGATLGCAADSFGGLLIDSFGRTSVPGVYAAGDSASFAPSQLIIAASGGSRAAIGVNTDLVQADFG